MIHHLSGAPAADRILQGLGGFSEAEIRPALLTLMGLGADRNPLETLGVPTLLRAAPLSA